MDLRFDKSIFKFILSGNKIHILLIASMAFCVVLIIVVIQNQFQKQASNIDIKKTFCRISLDSGFKNPAVKNSPLCLLAQDYL